MGLALGERRMGGEAVWERMWGAGGDVYFGQAVIGMAFLVCVNSGFLVGTKVGESIYGTSAAHDVTR